MPCRGRAPFTARRCAAGIPADWPPSEGKRYTVAKKVLVTEKVAEECITILKEKGLEVDVSLKTPPEELLRIIPDYDALIVRSATKVTREVIEAGARLKVVADM